MTHFYLKNKRVAMWSEAEIDAPSLEHIEMKMTEEQFNRLINNSETCIVDGEIIQNKSPQEWTEEQKENRKNLVENLKTQLSNAKNINDVIPILNSVLTELDK